MTIMNVDNPLIMKHKSHHRHPIDDFGNHEQTGNLGLYEISSYAGLLWKRPVI